MAKYLYLVFTDAVSPEREAEYNEYYSSMHIPDVLDVPGIVGGRRYKVSDTQGPAFAPLAAGQRYLAAYEIETDDIRAVDDELNKRVADGRLRQSDSLQLDPLPVGVYFELV